MGISVHSVTKVFKVLREMIFELITFMSITMQAVAQDVTTQASEETTTAKFNTGGLIGGLIGGLLPAVLIATIFLARATCCKNKTCCGKPCYNKECPTQKKAGDNPKTEV